MKLSLRPLLAVLKDTLTSSDGHTYGFARVVGGTVLTTFLILQAYTVIALRTPLDGMSWGGAAGLLAAAGYAVSTTRNSEPME